MNGWICAFSPFPCECFRIPMSCVASALSITTHVSSNSSYTFEPHCIFQDAVQVVELVTFSFAHEVASVDRHGEVSWLVSKHVLNQHICHKSCSLEDLFQQSVTQYACRGVHGAIPSNFLAIAIHSEASRKFSHPRGEENERIPTLRPMVRLSFSHLLAVFLASSTRSAW